MTIVEISALPNGAHNIRIGQNLQILPGWAEVEGELPETAPFVFVALSGNGKAVLTPDQDAYDAAMSVKSDEDGGADVPSDASFEARLTALEAEAEQAKADREALNILLGGAE